ncbi:MAG: phage tail tape measure protein [Desulfarculus sp.]|nr:MAG: phage tail tape measure protein [Desulfarculus sp.]
MPTTAAIIIKAIDHATAPMRYISQRFQAMDKQQRQALKRTAQAAGRYGKYLTGIALAVGALSLRQRAQTETALGDLASLGIKKLEALSEAARDFSNQWSGTTAPQFLTAAYDIKSAIGDMSDEGVAAMTRWAALTAKATKGSVGEMAALFAKGYHIFKEQFKGLSDLEFGKVFAAGISATVQAFTTTGPQMSAAIINLGKAATNANVPLAEQLAILGALQNTLPGERAGTAYTAFLRKAAAAGKALGLPFINANGQLKTTMEIMDLLRRKYGDKPTAVGKMEIQEAFGEEATRFVDLLIGKAELLRQATEKNKQAMADGGITAKMAQERNKGLGESFGKAAQQVGNLAEKIGKALAPVVRPLIGMLGRAAVRMQAWIEKHPLLTRAILIVAAGLGVLISVLGAATVAMIAFNTAAWANPITWIVAAVIAALVALAAAVVVFVAYWDDIAAWWKRFWAGFADTSMAVLRAIAGFFFRPADAARAAVDLITGHWSGIKGFFAGLWTWITEFWDSLDLSEAGKSLLASMWEGLKAAWEGIKAWFREQIDFLFSWLPDWAKEKLGLKMAATATGPGAAAPSAAAARAVPAPAPLVGRNTVDGVVKVEISGPPGTRVTRVAQRGDAGVDVMAGLTIEGLY